MKTKGQFMVDSLWRIHFIMWIALIHMRQIRDSYITAFGFTEFPLRCMTMSDRSAAIYKLLMTALRLRYSESLALSQNSAIVEELVLA